MIQCLRVKRLRRIILNIPIALSLLLCVASTGLWLRSSSHADYFWFTLPFGSDGHRPKFFLFHEAGIFPDRQLAWVDGDMASPQLPLTN